MDDSFYIAAWLIEPGCCQISRDGRCVRLRAKVMDLLVFLARHPGEVLSKDVLLDGVWGLEALSESTLTRTIAELRQAFGDDAGEPTILETIPKRGYRLIAHVSPGTAEVSPDTRWKPRVAPAALEQALRVVNAQPAPERINRGVWRALVPAAAGLILALALGFALSRSGRVGGPRQSGTIQSGRSDMPQMRAVRMPKMGLYGAGTPSFDGRWYSNTDLNEDLIIIDLASGTSRRLTNKGDSDETAEFSVMSPDGQLVAYAWVALDDVYELRVIGSNGSRPRVLVPRGHAEYIVPVEWSRDASEILCLLYQRGGLVQVGLVRVADGALRTVAETRGSVPAHVSLSPDSKFVVYDRPAADTASGQRDIFITSTDHADSRALIAHPANDASPVWTPDGSHVFFVSDRSGSPDGWIVSIGNGTAQDEPVLAVRDIGRVSISGFTSAGALYYWRQMGLMDVFTASIDGSSTSRLKPTRVASRWVGSNIGPAWSSDGRYLAYISRRSALSNVARASVLVIHDTQSGADRELTPDLALGVLSPRWSPDGRRLLVRGSDSRGKTGIFMLDVDDGRVVPGVVTDAAHMSEIGNRFGWWIDGQSIVYTAPQGLTIRNPTSGTDVRPFAATQSLKGYRTRGFELSPDGRSLAFAAVVEGTDPPAYVVAVTPIGGSPRALVRAVDPDQLFLQGWMPNGQELLFTRTRTDVVAPHELWRVSVDDARANDTGMAIPGFTQVNRVQVDPSGKTIAYTAGEASWALWVMEGFVSPHAR